MTFALTLGLPFVAAAHRFAVVYGFGGKPRQAALIAACDAGVRTAIIEMVLIVCKMVVFG